MIADRTNPAAPGGVPRSEAERSEAERCGTPPSTPAPDPEVDGRPRRRVRRPAAEKLRILRAAEACTKRGELGALLRREGIYSSTLADWRRQREQGVLTALAGDKPGRRPATADPAATRRLAELEREKRRLERRLKRAESIIEFQKKVAALLEIPLNLPDDEGSGS